MKIKNLVSGLLFATCAALSVPGHAVMLFSDNFDGEAPSSSDTNYTGLINWSVSNGTVDFIRQGNPWGISCFGGTGGCLDMDGSNGDAGRITSLATFNLSGGVFYHIKAEISGNQRFGGPDEIVFGLADQDGVPTAYWTSSGPVAWDSPFGSYSLGFTLASDMTSRLFFYGIGGDNIGVILDNVMFCEGPHETCHGTVPEPATLALFGLGLTGFAFARRRKQ